MVELRRVVRFDSCKKAFREQYAVASDSSRVLRFQRFVVIMY